MAQPAFGYWDRRDVRQRVHLEWGAWLDGWPWEWFVTATFRDPVGTEQADDRWRKWVREIEDAGQESLGWVRCTEYQRWRKGIPHYHALVLGVGQARRLSWMDRWNELAGFARILEYDPKNGARFYLGKYVTKGEGQIIVSPGLEHMCPGAPRPTSGPGRARRHRSNGGAGEAWWSDADLAGGSNIAAEVLWEFRHGHKRYRVR